MSTRKIMDVVRFVSQFDETGMANEASLEVAAIRRAAKALVDGGLTYGARNDGAFIEAVRLMEQIAKESKR